MNSEKKIERFWICAFKTSKIKTGFKPSLN